MDIVFRYCAVIAAGVAAVNWRIAERRLSSSDVGSVPEQEVLARRVVRIVFGSMIVSLLLIGLLQWAGGYSDPLFPFYDLASTPWSAMAWAIIGVQWTIHLVGIWRPGVAEAVLRAGFVHGPKMSARTLRLIVTLALLTNAVVFASLLAGIWGPLPRPTAYGAQRTVS